MIFRIVLYDLADMCSIVLQMYLGVSFVVRSILAELRYEIMKIMNFKV